MTPETSLRVLIVDDNPEFLAILQEGLSLAGNFSVTTALNGIEGLEQYEATQPDCVVVDVKMPELDGYQLVRALRGDPTSANVPLIILTALGQDKDRLGGELSGSDRFLVKPITPRELVTAIREAIAVTPTDRLQRLQAYADEDQSS